jgi:hypothetical protein
MRPAPGSSPSLETAEWRSRAAPLAIACKEDGPVGLHRGRDIGMCRRASAVHPLPNHPARKCPVRDGGRLCSDSSGLTKEPQRTPAAGGLPSRDSSLNTENRPGAVQRCKPTFLVGECRFAYPPAGSRYSNSLFLSVGLSFASHRARFRQIVERGRILPARPRTPRGPMQSLGARQHDNQAAMAGQSAIVERIPLASSEVPHARSRWASTSCGWTERLPRIAASRRRTHSDQVSLMQAQGSRGRDACSAGRTAMVPGRAEIPRSGPRASWTPGLVSECSPSSTGESLASHGRTWDTECVGSELHSDSSTAELSLRRWARAEAERGLAYR